MTRRTTPPALSAVRAAAGRKGGAAGATGGKGKDWPVRVALAPAERKRALAAARDAGLTAGEWLATLARRALDERSEG